MKLTKILLIICLVLASVFIVKAQITDSSQVSVTLISQDPDPVKPGDLLELRFKIENLGSESADDIVFELLPEYPFSMYSGEAVRSIGSLQARQISDEGIILLYKIRVDEKAIEGDNKLNIRYKFSKSDWIYVKDIAVRIRTEDIVLQIDDIATYPSRIAPGESGKLIINLKNMADSLVKDIKLNLDLTSTSIPIAPSRSGTIRNIYQIGSKQTKEVEFDIMASAAAAPQVYKVPLNITYYDEIGTKFERTDLISIVVGVQPDLSITMDSSTIYGRKQAGNVVFKIVNKGLADIKFMNVKLADVGYITPLSSTEVYVGNIDSDDYETAEFKMYFSSWGKDIEIPLNLEYMDSNNQKYSYQLPVVFRLYSPGEMKKYGFQKGSFAVIIFILLILAARYGYKKYKARKLEKMENK